MAEERALRAEEIARRAEERALRAERNAESAERTTIHYKLGGKKLIKVRIIEVVL